MAPIPVRHAQTRGSAVDTNIYVPGGFNSVDLVVRSIRCRCITQQPIPGVRAWCCPAARSGVATAAFNGLVYVIGGYNPTGTGHNEVYIYNPDTNSYTTGALMPAARATWQGCCSMAKSTW